MGRNRSRSAAARRHQADAPDDPALVTTPAAVETLVQEARAALSQSDREPLLAFDTEFIRERTFFSELALLQIATRERTWLVDPVALDAEALGPLLDLLTDGAVLKVAHAIEADQECLWHAYGLTAAPVLDTALAAALTGLGDQVGLGSLLRTLLSVRVPKGHARSDWLERPLPVPMARYARADVEHLVEAAELLLGALDRDDRRDWALELAETLSDTARFEPDPEGIARRLAPGAGLSPREFAVLRELASWREEQTRRSNIPRRWLADDRVLVALARTQPHDEAELRHFRGLGAKTREHGWRAIVAAVERGLEVPEADLPELPRSVRPDADEAPAVALLKCFVTELTRKYGVAARLLLDPGAAIALVRQRLMTEADLETSELLNPHALALIGGELAAFLSGTGALGLQKGRVRWRQLRGPSAESEPAPPSASPPHRAT